MYPEFLDLFDKFSLNPGYSLLTIHEQPLAAKELCPKVKPNIDLAGQNLNVFFLICLMFICEHQCPGMSATANIHHSR